MANAYLTYMAVGSPQEASILSNEHTWSILEVLRESGSRGLTPAEVHAKVEKKEGISVSRSKIYSLLKRLYELEWIHRYYDKDAEAQRNTVNYVWGGAFIDEEFYDEIKNKMANYMKKELFPIFENYFKKSISILEEDNKSKKWLPTSGKSSHCKKCHVSHEAEEFFDGIIEIAMNEFVNSGEYKKFLQANKFSDEED